MVVSGSRVADRYRSVFISCEANRTLASGSSVHMLMGTGVDNTAFTG